MESSAYIAATIADAMNKLKSGQVGEAISTLEQASLADPNDPQVHTCLGVAYTNKGDKAGAVSAFEKALSLQKSARGHYNLGLAYESVGRTDDALVQYRAAVAIDNNYTAACQAVERLAQASPVSPAVEPTIIGQAQPSAAIGAPPVAAPSNQTVLDITPDFTAVFKSPSAPPDLAREAYEKELRAQEQRREYVKSAVWYGVGCGAGFLLLVRLLPIFLAGALGGTGLEVTLLVLGTLVQGGIMGAIVGWWIGYTCGEDMQGALAGAVMGAVYGLMAGLIEGQGAFALFSMLASALGGAIFGFIVGRLVESSIGY